MKHDPQAVVRWVSLLAVVTLLWSPGQARAGAQGALTERQKPLAPRTASTSAAALPAAEGEVGVQATLSLYPVSDTEIREASPNANFSSTLPMYIGFRDSQRSRILLDLPLWNVPPGATIQSATLYLSLVGWYDYEGTARTLTAYRVTSLWHEELATWNHAPSVGSAVGSVSIGTPDPPQGWYALDLTNAVRDWFSGLYPNFGLMLVGPEGGDPVYRVLASAESTEGPRLDITYTSQAPTLSISPASLSFMADASRVAPAASSLRLQNSGSQPLEWTASTGGASWLTLSQSSGTLGAGSARVVTVGIDQAGLSQGVYAGTLQVTSATPGVVGSPQTAPVTLTYQSPLGLVYLPLVKNQGTGNPAGQKVAALYIGIADYQNLAPAALGVRAGDWGTDLKYAANDPKGVNTMLTNIGFFNPALGAGKADDALLLTEAGAKLADIRSAFEWLASHADENTLVIIFYSGHGGRVADDNGDESDGYDEFIAAYDTSQGSGTYANILRDDELNSLLSTLKSQRVVVFLDACFSGGMAGASLSGQSGGKGLAVPPGMLAADLSALDSLAQDVAGPGRIIVTASTATQSSEENEGLNHGVFTYYLLKGLMDSAADTSGNGWISVQEAFTYLASPVAAFTGGSQTPQIYDAIGSAVDLTHP
jgi:hypothetical protein